MVVILSLGLEWRIGSATDGTRPLTRLRSFAGGLHDTAVLTEHDGHAEGVQISLTLPGAYALFGMPMHELAHRTVDLEQVLGSDAHLVVERPASTADWEARFAILDWVLAARMSPERARIADCCRPGGPSSHDTAACRSPSWVDELGWSRKRLVAMFREQIGLPPRPLRAYCASSTHVPWHTGGARSTGGKRSTSSSWKSWFLARTRPYSLWKRAL